MIKVALMILAGLSYLFNSWFSLACITSFPFIALFSYWCGASFQPSFDEHFHRLFPSNCPSRDTPLSVSAKLQIIFVLNYKMYFSQIGNYIFITF